MMTSHSSLSVSGARFGTGTSTKSMSSSAVNSSNSSLRQNSLNGPRNSSPLMLVSSTLSTESPRLFVGTADGMGGPGSAKANSLPNRAPFQVSQRSWAMLHRLRMAHDRLENSLIGDMIGAASLFAAGWAALVIGYGMGW